MSYGGFMETVFCCKEMDYFANFQCDVHKNHFDCPDCIIYFDKDSGFGIIVHDGGESFIKISYCPWCGATL